jgi:hypothetical protein
VSDLDGAATGGVAAAIVAPGRRRAPTIAPRVTRRNSLPRPLVRDGEETRISVLQSADE